MLGTFTVSHFHYATLENRRFSYSSFLSPGVRIGKMEGARCGVRDK
jgi:hypothetical protein